jgi:hypothetical protein
VKVKIALHPEGERVDADPLPGGVVNEPYAQARRQSSSTGTTPGKMNMARLDLKRAIAQVIGQAGIRNGVRPI